MMFLRNAHLVKSKMVKNLLLLSFVFKAVNVVASPVVLIIKMVLIVLIDFILFLKLKDLHNFVTDTLFVLTPLKSTKACPFLINAKV